MFENEKGMGRKMNYANEMKIEFESKSQNESFARIVVAAFTAVLDPTLEEIADIKTAVSEAVTNCIIHGYEDMTGKIKIKCRIEDNNVMIEISDEGKGIGDINKAMEPLYTSKPELERSGMGFAFMEAFMDELEVISEEGKGTLVKMSKVIRSVKEGSFHTDLCENISDKSEILTGTSVKGCE